MKKVLFCWNGSINSALALNEIQKNPHLKVQALVTFLSEKTSSIEMNGLPETLIIDQAKLMNIPLVRIFVPDALNDLEKIKLAKTKLEAFKKAQIDSIIFDDLKNTATQSFNEAWAKEIGFAPIFPLVDKNTEELVQTFFKNEYRGIVTAINLEKLESSFLNKEYNQEWLETLPVHVSKLAHNAEFNTVITFGPLFKMRLNYSKSMAHQHGSMLVTLLKGP